MSTSPLIVSKTDTDELHCVGQGGCVITKYSTVVIEDSPDGYLLKCGRCNGSGENNREFRCRVCRGTGKVVLRTHGAESGPLRCARCDGRGENNREYFCRVCSGVGALMKPFPRVACASCEGTGESRREYFCSTCDGCGSVAIGEVPSY